MSDPKRHHWWPQLQSGYWCATDGYINVTDKNGVVFRTQPVNVGLEGHLYSLIDDKGTANPQIEKWLAKNIDGPFSAAIKTAFDLKKIQRRQFLGDPTRAKLAKEVGYRIHSYVEIIPLSVRDRIAISNYVASLLVRNPHYLKKLQEFHRDAHTPEAEVKNRALRNMLTVFRIYRKAIYNSEFILEVRDSDNEYLFGDSGIVADEPWNAGIPFDLHVPITPDLALEILPTPQLITTDMSLTRTSNVAIARHNRSVVAEAKRFVYSRGKPPVAFIKKHFGKPAPSPFGHRILNSEIEVIYDRTRDH